MTGLLNLPEDTPNKERFAAHARVIERLDERLRKLEEAAGASTGSQILPLSSTSQHVQRPAYQPGYAETAYDQAKRMYRVTDDSGTHYYTEEQYARAFGKPEPKEPVTPEE